MHQNQLLLDWYSFRKDLELWFGPSTYLNHQAKVFKLKQEGSVVDYQAKLEKLGNQVIGLSRDWGTCIGMGHVPPLYILIKTIYLTKIVYFNLIEILLLWIYC